MYFSKYFITAIVVLVITACVCVCIRDLMSSRLVLNFLSSCLCLPIGILVMGHRSWLLVDKSFCESEKLLLSLILRGRGRVEAYQRGSRWSQGFFPTFKFMARLKELIRPINLGSGIVSLREYSLFTSKVLYDLKWKASQITVYIYRKKLGLDLK